jgi:hypothetical protein
MKMENIYKILHFKVHPNIINLPRQMFWMEDKQIEAIEMLDAISSGALTINQCTSLLKGDAYFITEDEGKTLTLVEEPDIKWQEELAKHKDFLEQNKKGDLRLKEFLDDEYHDNEERRFSINEIKTVISGAVASSIKTKDVSIEEQMALETNRNLAKEMFIKKWETKDPGEKEALDNLSKKFANTIYTFDFNGHHYTYNDSARNQSRCPHCDAICKNTLWNKKDDKKAFIGTAHLNSDIYAHCFECPKCFEKFYYHVTKNDLGIDKN